jgi:hypothetical protein
MTERPVGRWSDRARGMRPAVLVLATLAVLATGCGGGGDTAADEGPQSFARQATKVRAAAADTRPWFCSGEGTGMPPSGHGNGSHVSSAYAGKSKGPLAWDDCQKLAEQLDRVVAITRGLETRDKGEAAGWLPVAGDYIPGLGTHHGKMGAMGGMGGGSTPGSIPGVDVQALTRCLGDRGIDVRGGSMPNFTDPAFTDALRACGAPLPAGGSPMAVPGAIPGQGSGTFDETAPQFLIYGGPQPDAPLVGVAYTYMGKGGPPEGFAGGNDFWHEHNKICMGGTGVLAGAEEVPDDHCASLGGHNVQITGPGGVLGDSGNFVLHLWLPPYEYRPDLFVSGNPCLLDSGAAPKDDPCWQAARRDPSPGSPAHAAGAHDGG